MRLGLYLACCALAGALPLLPKAGAAPEVTGFPGWPDRFAGRKLEPVPLSEREARFFAGFPGRVGRFTDGSRQLVLRWVASPTRRLHPASDCYRGLGYAIRPLPAVKDGDGIWGRFEARRGDQALIVRERITDSAGRGWGEVSEWYWATLFKRTEGPWWAATIAELSTLP